MVGPLAINVLNIPSKPDPYILPSLREDESSHRPTTATPRKEIVHVQQHLTDDPIHQL